LWFAQFVYGYLQAFNFNPGLRIMIRDYRLREILVVKKIDAALFYGKCGPAFSKYIDDGYGRQSVFTLCPGIPGTC